MPCRLPRVLPLQHKLEKKKKKRKKEKIMFKIGIKIPKKIDHAHTDTVTPTGKVSHRLHHCHQSPTND